MHRLRKNINSTAAFNAGVMEASLGSKSGQGSQTYQINRVVVLVSNCNGGTFIGNSCVAHMVNQKINVVKNKSNTRDN